MNIPLNILILITGFAVLIKSADYLVNSAVKVAEMLGIPRVVIAIVIISLGTTAPEFAVSVIAA